MAAVALIEVTEALDKFEVLRKCAIIFATWAAIASGAWPVPLFELPARRQFFKSTPWIIRISVSVFRVDWKTICGIANKDHVVFSILWPASSYDSSRNAMVVVQTRGLDMCMAVVKAEMNFSGQCIVVPARLFVEVPDFRRSWLKGHAIERDTHRVSHGMGEFVGELRLQCHAEGEFLFTNRVRVSAIGKYARKMVWNPV